MKIRTVVIATLGLSAVAAGCGGGETLVDQALEEAVTAETLAETTAEEVAADGNAAEGVVAEGAALEEPVAEEAVTEDVVAEDAAAAAPTPGGTLTAEEYRSQADAICAQAGKDLDALAEEALIAAEEPTEADLQSLIDQVVPRMTTQADDLASLAPPSELAADHEAMLAGARAAIEVFKTGGVVALGVDDPFAEPNRLAAKLGLVDCAEG